MEELHELDIEEVIEDLEFFTDWQEKYRYIIELGKKIPPLAPQYKTDTALVKGCISQIWLVYRLREDGCIEFMADSDAAIVKGLVALLFIIFSGKTPNQILNIDFEKTFLRLELEQHISANRRNGFSSMVNYIRQIALENKNLNPSLKKPI